MLATFKNLVPIYPGRPTRQFALKLLAHLCYLLRLYLSIACQTHVQIPHPLPSRLLASLSNRTWCQQAP